MNGIILAVGWSALYLAVAAACLLPHAFALPSACGPFMYADLPGLVLSPLFEDFVARTLPVGDLGFLFYSQFLISALLWFLVGGIAGLLVRRRALAVVAATLVTVLILCALFAMVLLRLGPTVG